MKIVNLKDYKYQKHIKKQIEELDQLGEHHYKQMSSDEQTGYRNFMRLLKALDEKHRQDISTQDDPK